MIFEFIEVIVEFIEVIVEFTLEVSPPHILEFSTSPNSHLSRFYEGESGPMTDVSG